MANNGIAYGFTGLTELMNTKVVTYGEGLIRSAIDESAAEHTRAAFGLLSRLAYKTTKGKDLVELPTAGELQPIDARGNPVVTQQKTKIEVGYPIFGGGDAWGNDRVSRRYMTIQNANDFTLNVMGKDMRWLRRRALAALFTNTNWTFYDDTNLKLGNITILPLANTDGTKYIKNGGEVEEDEHYLYLNSAIADATNPYGTIYTELAEHPSNTGDIVCYIPTNLVATTEALASFVPVKDTALQYGIATTQLADMISWNTDAIRGPGDNVLGRTDKCWIVEWKALPSSYIVSQCINRQPLGFREFDEPSLQGLFMENNSPDGNLQELRYLRFGGFGVGDRVAACITKVGAGSYSIPSGYSAPIAV